ncbi:MAG: hypothetical protein GY810_28860 [Aureispira sp.]|nr:hypothetical protein [Aureispira sp.]
MNKVIYLLLASFLLSSCSEQSNSTQNEVEESVQDFSFQIKGLEDDSISMLKDAELVYPYKTLEGKTLEFGSNTVIDIKAKIQFTFGFLQYTIDDSPAALLELRKTSEWKELNVQNGQLLIPDFHNNSSNPKVSEVLSLEDNNAIGTWVLTTEMDSLKAQSLRAQAKIFNMVLADKTKYEECCPEYIEQAQTFFNKKEEAFQSVEALAVELICTKMEIQIEGKLANGKNFSKMLIAE